jgi:uncharacterized peroxidase-related enzyme
MPHIKLPSDAPGIIGPMLVYPETQRELSGLAEALLRGPSSLTQAERELIASYVSFRNECVFCTQSHAATARELFGENQAVVDQVLANIDTAQVDEKLRALLGIADKVRRHGRLVGSGDVELARQAGADDKAIHDTVLIAAAFCMFNRYVDGLATSTPEESAVYKKIGQMLASEGYRESISRRRASILTVDWLRTTACGLCSSVNFIGRLISTALALIAPRCRKLTRLARKTQCAVKSHGSPVEETKQAHPETIRSARNHLEG